MAGTTALILSTLTGSISLIGSTIISESCAIAAAKDSKNLSLEKKAKKIATPIVLTVGCLFITFNFAVVGFSLTKVINPLLAASYYTINFTSFFSTAITCLSVMNGSNYLYSEKYTS